MTESFERELLRRSPLAAVVLETCDFVFDSTFLRSIWGRHRGRCYEDVLTFEDFVRLMRDALVNHGGSAHQLFVDLEHDGREPCDESNFYRKLARTPVELSRALLRDGTRRLRQLLPGSAGPVVELPACFDRHTLVVGDGKKIKDAAKRLAPTRGYRGKLLGAKTLVALDVRSGMALAMSDSLDGMTNDVPLVPELVAQLHQVVPGAMLSVWDRQFDDVATMRQFCRRDGDAFVVRAKQRDAVFTVESTVKTADERGRPVLDEIGVLGRRGDEQQMRLRRITLVRGGGRRNEDAVRREQGRRQEGGGRRVEDAEDDDDDDDVVLFTNLPDREAYPAADLLALYRHRWGIEQVFQQVTETFSLSHLIGSSPKATLLQFGYCLLLYNLMQLIKIYVAEDGGVLAGVVSMFYLFNDVKRELSAWAYHATGAWPRARARRDATQMRDRLAELLKGSWHPLAYKKASDKKPRGKPKPKPLLRGGHTSVQRMLEGKIALA